MLPVFSHLFNTKDIFLEGEGGGAFLAPSDAKLGFNTPTNTGRCAADCIRVASPADPGNRTSDLVPASWTLESGPRDGVLLEVSMRVRRASWAPWKLVWKASWSVLGGLLGSSGEALGGQNRSLEPSWAHLGPP